MKVVSKAEKRAISGKYKESVIIVLSFHLSALEASYIKTLQSNHCQQKESDYSL